MGFAVILIVTIALVIFFCMDCSGKINRQAEGTGVIYLAVPMLLTIILCICSFRWKSEIDIFDSIDEYGYFWESKFKDILALAGMCILSILPAVLSVIGCVRLALHNGKTKEQQMFGSPDDDIHCLSVWSKTSTALGAVCTAAFSVFAAIAAVSAFSFAAVSSLKLIAATILIGCLTFGIGFIVMAVLFPMWVLIVGFHTIMSSLPMVLAACVSGTALIVFQVMSAVFMSAQVKKLVENGSITKKKAALYIFLSLLPVVSIVNAARISKKLSVGA